MIFLDSNIVIDLVTGTGEWSAWAVRQVTLLEGNDSLVCNLIVVAEVASGLHSADTLLDDLDELSVDVLDLDVGTAFRAAVAHREYRRRGGARTTILPDFLIAAHAATFGARLMTRDRRLGSYFPDLILITPETHP